VTLGLATQLELDAVVRKAADKKAKDDVRRGVQADGPTLRPAAEAGAYEDAAEDEDFESDEAPNAADVFEDAEHED
jgi:hypothetical protein